MSETPSVDPAQDIDPEEGGYEEHEFYLSADDAAAFLRDLADQLESGQELTVTGDGWAIPFRFDDTVEVEVEAEPGNELEIEVELQWSRGDDRPGVE